MEPTTPAKLLNGGKGSSASKVVIFTPDQLQQLGFAEQFKDVISKQVNPSSKTQNKRGPYKKRHPKLVKDKAAKSKVITNEKSSELIKKSLKIKLGKVVKAGKNLLPDSAQSEFGGGENIQSDEIEDVEVCNQINTKKVQAIPETTKLQTSSSRNCAEDTANFETDQTSVTTPSTNDGVICDDAILEIQQFSKEDVVRDLFNAKIGQINEVEEHAVKEDQQEDNIIAEAAKSNMNERGFSLNSDEINAEIEKVKSVSTEGLTMNDYEIEQIIAEVGGKETEDFQRQGDFNEEEVEQLITKEMEDIQSEQIGKNKKYINCVETESSGFVQNGEGNQSNEENVSLELVKPHQTKKQSVDICETMEENVEKIKQINEDTSEVLQIKHTRRSSRIDYTMEEVVEGENEITQNSSRNILAENKKETVSEVSTLHEENSDVAKQDTVEEVQTLNKNQVSVKILNKGKPNIIEKEELTTQLKLPLNGIQSARSDYAENIEEVQKLSKEEQEVAQNINQNVIEENRREAVVVLEVLQEKSPLTRLKIGENSDKPKEFMKLHEKETQVTDKNQEDETKEENIEKAPHFNEELVILNGGQLKSPSKRKPSVRIDYGKNNENIEEEKKESVVIEAKEEASVSKVMHSKSPLTRKRNLRKSETNEEKIEEAQHLNEEIAIQSVRQLKSPLKRRRNVRKGDENSEEVKKINEEEKKESVVVETKEDASVSEIVQSKPLLTRRQSVRKSLMDEETIEGAQHLNDEFAIPGVGLLKSSSKRRASARINCAKGNENKEEENKIAENKKLNVIAENKKKPCVVQEVLELKSHLTRKKREKETSEEDHSDIPKKNTDEEVKKLNEKKESVPHLERRHSTRISHTNDEKLSTENEKDAASPETTRLKPQLKRRKNARIHETKNDGTQQDKEERPNHNRRQNEIMEEVEQDNETSQLKPQQRRRSRTIVDSKSTDAKEETVKINLKSNQNRKKSVKNDEVTEEVQQLVLGVSELKPTRETRRSIKIGEPNSFKIKENVTKQPQDKEENFVADGLSVEEKQKVNQLEDQERVSKIDENKKKVEIMTNEVVFFSPSDIQNLTKNSKCKPKIVAANSALVFPKKTVNLQEIQSENEKINEGKELSVKGEKMPPKCYTRKNKNKITANQNLSSQDSKKSEDVSTIITTDLTLKEGDEVEEETHAKLDPKNGLSKNLDESVGSFNIIGSRLKSVKKTEEQIGVTQTKNDNTEILQNISRKRGGQRKSTLFEIVETSPETLVKTDALENDPSSSKTTILPDNTEILPKTPRKKGRPRKSTPVSKPEVVETAPEINLTVEADKVKDDSLSPETNKSDILEKIPRKRGRRRNSALLATGVEAGNSPETTISPNNRSKRKRKVVDYTKLSKVDESDVDSSDDIVILKKPKRRKKDDDEVFEIDVNITPNPKTDEIDCSYSEVKKRVKRSESKCAQLFNSLVQNAKLSETPQRLTDVDVQVKPDKKQSNSNIATCAVCKLEMEKKAWANHKLKKHNNLAWKVGEKPLDLNDNKFVLSVLNQMYKDKKGFYFCDLCENITRSVQGYLSHRSRCQKSTQDLIDQQVICQHCERGMLPVSVYTHSKFCRGLKANDGSLDGLEKNAQGDSPLPKKRKAAEKASKFITALKEEDDHPKDRNINAKKWIKNYNFDVSPWAKKIIQQQCQEKGSANCCFKGCEYQNSNWFEIFSHFKECTKKFEGYSCKLCLSTFETKPQVIEHLKNHVDEFNNDESFIDGESSDSNDEEEEDDGSVNCKKRKDNKGPPNIAQFKSNFQFKFSGELNAISMSTPTVFPSAWKWTFNFCRENFSELNLFSNWRNSFLQNLDLNKIGAYLPKQKYSVCTSVIKCKKYVDPLASDYDWKRFNLFESSKSDSEVSSIFCGGTVSAIAWLPTPYEVETCEQILAVAIQPDLETKYRVNQFYSDPGLIQFWNCGTFKTAPQLQFCIAHDYNPIWALEWCPSGCYDVEPTENEVKRLGILAVGSGNSNVYLYSVCEPSAASGKIIKMKPIKKLSLVMNTKQFTATLKPHVSKISWTKASGHQHIAVGYTSGMVAIYNLKDLSDFLKYTGDDELETQQPYLTINAHVHSVTALTLSHISDGCRWLMTASADRTIKYWDLRQPTTPITSTSKFVVTDGVWLTHWLCSILCFDDSCNTGITQTSLHQVRNFKSESCNVMHSNSAIQCINSCDWTNGLIQGNAAGEIQGFFPHQLLHGMDNCSKYFKKKKAILSYCRLVEKNVSIKERLERENEKLKLMVSKPKEVVDISQITSNPNRFKSEPVTYKGAENKYGVVFCDYQMNKLDEFQTSFNDYTNSHSEKYYPTRPNLYPMQCVTKVQFNSNRGFYNYFAAGYQIGFVRIFPMKFISTK